MSRVHKDVREAVQGQVGFEVSQPVGIEDRPSLCFKIHKSQKRYTIMSEAKLFLAEQEQNKAKRRPKPTPSSVARGSRMKAIHNVVID